MHWTRIGIIASSAIALIGTCLPWLVNVPPNVLTIGDGSIYGITTVQGMIAAACAAGAIAIALLVGNKTFRISRGAGAGVIALAVVTIGIGSLVIGTSQSELLEEAEKQTLEKTGDQHIANLAVIAMGKILDKHPMDKGPGALPFALGCAGMAIMAIIGMFVSGGPKPGGDTTGAPPHLPGVSV